MQIKYVPLTPGQPPSVLRKLAVLVTTLAMIGLALMFSAVLLLVVAIIGTLGWAYLWWKTRELRKQMRDFQAQATQRAEMASNDEVFEGEVIRVVDPQKER